MSPALAEAAMEGRLPRGFCIKRLTDLPMLWSEQWGAIGLQAPAQVRAELRRLPNSIQNVVLARTDLLSVQDRRAIQAASVLGQRFSLPHLRALLQEPRYACDTLVRNVLLR